MMGEILDSMTATDADQRALAQQLVAKQVRPRPRRTTHLQRRSTVRWHCLSGGYAREGR